MSTTAASPLDVAAAKKAEKDKQKTAKTKLMKDFIDTTTIDDVVWSGDASKFVAIGSGDKKKMTKLQSIKGMAVDKLTVPHLKAFCVKHSIGGYKNLDKYGLCELIAGANKSKNLQSQMYPEDSDKPKSKPKKSSGSGTKKAKKKNKKTKPPCVKNEGTFYRVILTLFAPDMRPHVVDLGKQPNKQSLDKREMLHHAKYEALATAYNDAKREDLEKLPKDNEFWDTHEVATDVPSTFDTLTAEEFSDCVDYLNHWYKECMGNCKKSGKHDEFGSYVGNRPFLFLYWQLMDEGPIEIAYLAVPDLPEDARQDSSRKPKAKPKSTRKPRGGKGQASKDVNTLATALRESSEQRTLVMQARTATQNEAMLLHKQKHAVEHEEKLSDLFNKHSVSLHEARNHLRALRDRDDYDSDSSEARELQESIDLWKKKRDDAKKALDSHSATAPAAVSESSRITKNKKVAPKGVKKSAKNEIIAIDSDLSNDEMQNSKNDSEVLSSSSSDSDLQRPVFGKPKDKENGSGNTQSPEKKRQRVSENGGENSDDERESDME